MPTALPSAYVRRRRPGLWRLLAMIALVRLSRHADCLSAVLWHLAERLWRP